MNHEVWVMSLSSFAGTCYPYLHGRRLYNFLSIIRANRGEGDTRITEKHELSELYILYTDPYFS
jgi:hypothetical protein